MRREKGIWYDDNGDQVLAAADDPEFIEKYGLSDAEKYWGAMQGLRQQAAPGVTAAPRPTYSGGSYAAKLGAKPVYSDSYGDEMRRLYEQYAGRGPFQYDATKDPLYQGYKDQYIQQGKLAMRDTMGQAAALTGGYGSTYGLAVGQQAYDAHLQKLGEVIPTLYGMAYNQWQDQGDKLLKQYGLLGDMQSQEYARYRDALGDWESERNYLNQREQQDYNRYRDSLADWESERAYQTQLEAEDYRRRTAEEQTAYERAWSQDQRDYERNLTAETMAYDRQQQAYKNLYAMISASGYHPTNEELQAAGMTREAADAIWAEFNRKVAAEEYDQQLREMSALGYTRPTSSGGSSGGGGSGRSGGGGGYSGGGGGSYGGDIWDEAQAQYKQYGYQNTSNDLFDMWQKGEITGNQYARGQSAADILWTQDHVTNVAKSVVSKNTGSNTTATETAEERRRRLKDKQADRL